MAEYLETRFNAKFINPESFEPIYHSSAFSTPNHLVITDADPNLIQNFQWGLIPSWVKNEEKAKKIAFNTFNARAETVFEKPSFRNSIKNRRCLILVDGFFEWQEVKGKKYPYYIKMTDSEAFALAGIWDTWENKSSGAMKNTFSIITTSANPLLEKIHNTKKRMPVILKQKDETLWLNNELDDEEIKSILVPYDNKNLEGFTVSKLISTRGQNSNVPEVLEKYEYEELRAQQKSLF